MPGLRDPVEGFDKEMEKHFIYLISRNLSLSQNTLSRGNAQGNGECLLGTGDGGMPDFLRSRICHRG